MGLRSAFWSCRCIVTMKTNRYMLRWCNYQPLMSRSMHRRTGDQRSTPAPIHRMREYISGKEGDDTRSVSDRCAGTCFWRLCSARTSPNCAAGYVRSI